ncbi:MAG: Myticin pre-proprotein from the mussel [Rhodobacteraceae bacterium HLUCCA12]|nr:MAG: Myticin pre-proprotein from the mussel [Rhodobacteraceae bacterium HLUCCA12]
MAGNRHILHCSRRHTGLTLTDKAREKARTEHEHEVSNGSFLRQ